MLRRWQFGRLHIFWGIGDRYGLELMVDFNNGWGVVLGVFNCYLVLEWWPSER